MLELWLLRLAMDCVKLKTMRRCRQWRFGMGNSFILNAELIHFLTHIPLTADAFLITLLQLLYTYLSGFVFRVGSL